MNQLQDLVQNIAATTSVEDKLRLTQFLGSVLQNVGKKFSAQERQAVCDFAMAEVHAAQTAIETAKTYRDKDLLFQYADMLLRAFTLADCPKTDAQLETVKSFLALDKKERVLENAVDDLFSRKNVQVSDVEQVLQTVKSLTDEYQRAQLFGGLLHYADKIGMFSPEAKAAFSAYLADETARLLKLSATDKDAMLSLEFAVDACKLFIDDKVIAVLRDVLTTDNREVLYYAVATLVACRADIPQSVIETLAADVGYADLLYTALKRARLSALYPQEYADPAYLAKSALVRWLEYPTELNMRPDEIELLGDVKVKREHYYIFRFKSASDTLDEENQNVWLIGWSGTGGTFSNFDRLENFQKKTPEKTLKYIVKKLL